MPTPELAPLTVDDDATVVQDGPLHTGSGRTDDVPEAAAPASLGRYVILAEIGVGGMGRVFRAYDPKLDREVAVKLLRRVTKDARSRLRREAQAMAQLSHPNVLPIYDVADDGRHVFIAMELVRGQSVREWLDADARAWTEVLAVFRAAGAGLCAAHEAGIVHRDFKPANVLLGEDGRVRVMDFGLARGTAEPGEGSPGLRSSGVWSHGLDESSSGPSGMATPGLRSSDSHDVLASLADDLTQLGTVVGTPAYMAPEQHLGHAADPRCDQYGFCVTLWEALYGRRPFEAEGLTDWYKAKTTATPRHDPERPVPPWLRAVALRGLSAAPSERFGSMAALLHALAQGAHRRRTHRTAALVLGGVVLVGGIGLSLRGAPSLCSGAEDKLRGIWDAPTASLVERAVLASDVSYAAETWARVAPQLEGYAARWQAAHEDACAATHVRREQPEALMDARMRCLEDRRRSLRALVRTLQATDAEADAEIVVERAVSAVGALPAIEACADPDYVRAQALPPADPQHAAEVEALEEELARIKALTDAGRSTHVEAAARTAVERGHALGHASLEARARLRLGMIADDLGRYEEGAAELEQAYFIAQRHDLDGLQASAAVALMHVLGNNMGQLEQGEQWARFAEAALERAHDPVVEASYLGNAGLLASERGDHGQALVLQERALALREQQLDPDHPLVATILNNLALVHDSMGRFAEARALLQRSLAIRERALGPMHPEVASSLLNLANLDQTRADPEAARERLRRALTIYESAYGHDHPLVAGTLVNLGNLYEETGEPQRALASYQEALPILERARGSHHLNVIGTIVNVGNVYRTLGEPERAVEHYDRALQRLEKTQGNGFLHAIVLANMSSMAFDRDDLDAAQAHALRGLELVAVTPGVRHPLGALLQANLALVHSARGRHDEALRLHREALATRRELLGPQHPETATSQVQLGEALVAAGKAGEAIEPLAEAERLLADETGMPGLDERAEILQHARFALARARWDVGIDRPAMRTAAQAARDALHGLPGDHAHAVAQMDAWLAAPTPGTP